MNLDPKLLEIIVCPADHGPLTPQTGQKGTDGTDGTEELVCGSCGLAYPVRDDIPVLLVDQARQPG